MWNVRSGNKLVERNLKQAAQRRHLQALSRTRGLVNHSSPKRYDFLYSRPKAHQIRLEREMEIESNNSILVSRMVSSSCHTAPSVAYLKDSLNTPLRSRLERVIDNANKKLVHRLSATKSQYRQEIQYNREFDKYRISMAYSRMAPFYQFDSVSYHRSSNRPLSSKH